mgnify:CR=1 FL=1
MPAKYAGLLGLALIQAGRGLGSSLRELPVCEAVLQAIKKISAIGMKCFNFELFSYSTTFMPKIIKKNTIIKESITLAWR